ncbi:MAG: hypothetical protein WD749_02300 [Phycisphaerales bacterium]
MREFKPFPQWTSLEDHAHPYISGNGFAVRCRFIANWDPPKVHPTLTNNWFFVRTQYVELLYERGAPPFPFVLFTANSDDIVGEKHRRIADDPRVQAWFTVNAGLVHSKVHPIPIGIANPGWEHGDVSHFNRIRAEAIPRTRLFYANYALRTNRAERERCLAETGIPLAQTEGDGWQGFGGGREMGGYPQPLPFERYLRDLASTFFCISPHGNGIDCHRTWEALYLGAIPVVTRSRLTDAHRDIPMIVLDDWSDFRSINFSPELHQRTWGSFDITTLHMDRYMKRVEALIPSTPR